MDSIAVRGGPVNICRDTLYDGDELDVSYGPARYWERRCIQGFAVTMKPGTGGAIGLFPGELSRREFFEGYAVQPLCRWGVSALFAQLGKGSA